MAMAPFCFFSTARLCFDRSGWFVFVYGVCVCVLTVWCELFCLGGRKHWFSRSLVRLLNRFTVGIFCVWDEFDGDVKFGIVFVLFLASVFPCFGDKVWDVFICFR